MNRSLNGDGRTIEVCREFLHDRCKRSVDECRYAHPPTHVEVFNGRVTCCVDSLRDKCKRDDPPCRYMHPPQHLKEMLLASGRGTRSSGGYSGGGGAGGYAGSGGPRSGAGDSYRDDFVGVNPYFDGAPGGQSEYYGSASQGGGRKGSWMDSQERSSKSNTIEVCREFLRGRCNREPDDCRYAHPPPHINVGSDNGVTVCMDFIRGYCNRNACRYFHPPARLQSRVRGGGGGGSSGSYGRKRSHPDDYNNGDNYSSTKRQATDDLYA